MKAGIVHEPDAEYRKTQAVNSSLLKCLKSQSPAHAKLIWDGTKPDDDSVDRKFGRAEHCYILEDKDEFESRFLISTTCAAIKKGDGMPCENAGVLFDGNQWFCKTKGHAPADAEEPRDYINPSELERIQQVSLSIHQHPCIAALKSKGWSEVSVYFEFMGLPCKARLDRFSESRGLIIDLKKMDRTDLTVLNCQSQAASLDYFIQAAFYIKAIQAAKQIDPKFMFIFAESHPPYCAIPAQVCSNTTPDTLNVANGWVEYLCEEWAECLSDNKYPGPWDNPFAAKLHAPKWYLDRPAPERQTV